jgi:hypothetical protein
MLSQSKLATESDKVSPNNGRSLCKRAKSTSSRKQACSVRPARRYGPPNLTVAWLEQLTVPAAHTVYTKTA